MKLTQLIFIFLLAFSQPLYAQYETTVKVGEKAPPLSIQEWVKGIPVSEFRQGQLYVVEFSATWCAPCRKSIPHLTELANYYKGKVTFISIYMEDNNQDDFSDTTYVKKVKYLIDGLRDKVGFSVAVDVPQKTTKNAWGINGIPASFVVNKSGVIEWVGHPLKLDKVLKDLLVNRFDSVKTKQTEEDFKKRIAKILQANEIRNYNSALLGVDSLINENPNEKWLYSTKFSILVGKDSKEAYAMLQSILDSKIEGFIWGSLESEFIKIPRANRNFEIELRTLDRAIEEAETVALAAPSWQSKATVYATMGDFGRATECAQKSVDCWNEMNDNNSRESQIFALGLAKYKYRLLLDEDPKRAKAWLKSEVGNKKIKYIDQDFVSAILNTSNPDYELVLDLLDNKLEQGDVGMRRGYMFDLKSKVYEAMGDFGNAIECCKFSIDEYNKNEGNKHFAKKQEKRLSYLLENQN